jgi:ABC-type sugar transport system substrate-binding protein
MEKAQAKVDEYTQPPTEYPGPTEPVTVTKGKAAVIACGFVAAVCKSGADEAVDVLKTVGWDAGTALDGELTPQTQSAIIDRAVESGVDAIVMIALTLDANQQSTQRALDAGVFIVCVQCANSDTWKGKAYDVAPGWQQQGAIHAWEAMAQSGEDAKVITAVDSGSSPTTERAKGIEQTLGENCTSCTFERLEIPSDEVVKPGPPPLTAMLASKPAGSITNFVSYYDALGLKAAQTAADSGRTEIKFSGYEPTVDSIKAILTGKPAPYSSSVVAPFDYEVWAGVDLVLRNTAGVELWANSNEMPSMLLDASNAADFADGSTPGPEGYQDNFLKLWGQK